MSHWSKLARTWALLGPPLRPSPEDTAIIGDVVARAANGHAIEMLVLGVTPELVTLPLPVGSSIIAVDREPAMVELLFQAGPDRRALVGDWRFLPLPDASVDVAVGDGCASLFAFPDELRAFFADVARVVRPSGLVSLRLFASPERTESLDEVRAALPSIRSFHALKWRIAMAVQSPSRAVEVTSILDAFNSLIPDRDALIARTGWSRDVVEQIDSYRSSPAVYWFPTVSDVRTLLAPAFAEVAFHIPHYELGDRCPTLVLRRTWASRADHVVQTAG